jgi:hypothetical protein
MIIWSYREAVRTHSLVGLLGGSTRGPKPWFKCVRCGATDGEGNSVGWGELNNPCPNETKDHADLRIACRCLHSGVMAITE